MMDYASAEYAPPYATQIPYPYRQVHQGVSFPGPTVASTVAGPARQALVGGLPTGVGVVAAMIGLRYAPKEWRYLVAGLSGVAGAALGGALQQYVPQF